MTLSSFRPSRSDPVLCAFLQVNRCGGPDWLSNSASLAFMAGAEEVREHSKGLNAVTSRSLDTRLLHIHQTYRSLRLQFLRSGRLLLIRGSYESGGQSSCVAKTIDGDMSLVMSTVKTSKVIGCVSMVKAHSSIGRAQRWREDAATVDGGWLFPFWQLGRSVNGFSIYSKLFQHELNYGKKRSSSTPYTSSRM